MSARRVIPRTIGARIREARRLRRCSQSKLAQLLDMPDAWRKLSLWERERNAPRSEVLARIAVVLDVSADYLLGLADDPLELSSRTPIRRGANWQLPLFNEAG